MEDPEHQVPRYHYLGIPVTPQATRLGYEFPVYVSENVWANCCAYNGSSRHDTNLDRRINELLASCYEGMLKKLTQTDDFVFYEFKHWFWERYATAAKSKKEKAKLGARLFLGEDGGPWLYIFDPVMDNGSDLKVVDDGEEQ